MVAFLIGGFLAAVEGGDSSTWACPRSNRTSCTLSLEALLSSPARDRAARDKEPPDPLEANNDPHRPTWDDAKHQTRAALHDLSTMPAGIFVEVSAMLTTMANPNRPPSPPVYLRGSAGYAVTDRSVLGDPLPAIA